MVQCRDSRRKYPKKKTNILKIIKDGGYFDQVGNWNSIIKLYDEGDKLFRGRVETLVFQEDKVFLNLSSNGKYRVPGGSYNYNTSPAAQAKKEVLEECKIIVDDIRYTDISYKRIYDNNPNFDRGKIHWNGTYTQIFVADFKDYFYGHIDASVFDADMHRYGKFHKIKDVYHLLIPEHKKCIDKLFKGVDYGSNKSRNKNI